MTFGKKLLLIFITTLFTGCASIDSKTIEKDSKKYKIVSIYYNKKIPRPTVIVLHGCDGVLNPSYHKWATRINDWGYNAVVIDSFSTRGYSDICDKPFDVLPKERADDLLESVSFIRSQSWHVGPIGAIGFSHGASTGLYVASTNKDNIDFLIAYYPSCWYTFVGADIYNLHVPTQLHLAEKDTWAPAGQCFINQNNTEQFLYLGTTHAFDMDFPNRNKSGHFLKYDRNADKISQTRTKSFIDNIVQVSNKK